ncbi:PD-(D/E)XK nuclease family protein [Candidatus Neomarinimicrobiota bacterium]
MSLFVDIESKKGEVMATAILRHLILRSPLIRDTVISIFSKYSPQGLIDTRSHFSCYLEHPTSGEGEEFGRIDMIIETDEVVVGVESKLYAGFQTEQPKKYETTIKNLATKLGPARNREETLKWFIAILAPNSRRDEIQLKYDSETCRFVPWNEVNDAIRSLRETLDQGLQFLVTEYLVYMDDLLEIPNHFEKLIPHTQHKFNRNGSSEQNEFLRIVSRFFPHPRKISYAKIAAGVYFSLDENGIQEGWFGFIAAERVKPVNSDKSSFVIATSWKTEQVDEKFFRQGNFRNWLQSGRSEISWVVDLDDPLWASPKVWQERLMPLLTEIKT